MYWSEAEYEAEQRRERIMGQCARVKSATYALDNAVDRMLSAETEDWRDIARSLSEALARDAEALAVLIEDGS